MVVEAGENQANIILKKVIKHKDINDPNKLKTYQYEVYNKLEFGYNDVSDKMKKIIENHRFLYGIILIALSRIVNLFFRFLSLKHCQISISAQVRKVNGR